MPSLAIYSAVWRPKSAPWQAAPLPWSGSLTCEPNGAVFSPFSDPESAWLRGHSRPRSRAVPAAEPHFCRGQVKAIKTGVSFDRISSDHSRNARLLAAFKVFSNHSRRRCGVDAIRKSHTTLDKFVSKAPIVSLFAPSRLDLPIALRDKASNAFARSLVRARVARSMLSHRKSKPINYAMATRASRIARRKQADGYLP